MSAVTLNAVQAGLQDVFLVSCLVLYIHIRSLFQISAYLTGTLISLNFCKAAVALDPISVVQSDGQTERSDL